MTPNVPVGSMVVAGPASGSRAKTTAPVTPPSTPVGDGKARSLVPALSEDHLQVLVVGTLWAGAHDGTENVWMPYCRPAVEADTTAKVCDGGPPAKPRLG